jgi:hypothetical protein
VGTSGSETLFRTFTILRFITGEFIVVHVIVICELVPNVILAVADNFLLLTLIDGTGRAMNKYFFI